VIKVITKEQLIEEIRKVTQRGWIKSVKRTRNVRNDGAVGNTLEKLLGIPENNLPIANANGWELKGQRLHTSSLVTLKHYEPFPGEPILSPRCCFRFTAGPTNKPARSTPETR
jgi:hypothetical protein